MSIAINYKASSSKKHISNLVLFVDEKFNTTRIKKHVLSSEYSFISENGLLFAVIIAIQFVNNRDKIFR